MLGLAAIAALDGAASPLQSVTHHEPALRWRNTSERAWTPPGKLPYILKGHSNWHPWICKHMNSQIFWRPRHHLRIHPEKIRPLDPSTNCRRKPASVCGLAASNDGTCVDLCEVTPRWQGKFSSTRPITEKPVVFLPDRYPKHKFRPADRDARWLGHVLDKSQQKGHTCDFKKTITTLDYPGMGVIFHYVTANFINAALRNTTFSPGPNYMRIMTTANACGLGRRNIYCFFRPFTRCLNAARAAMVYPSEPNDRFSFPSIVAHGSFWLEAQVLRYWFRLNEKTAAFVRAKRSQINFTHPIIGIQVRRGDACANKRFCPPLSRSYLPVILEMRKRYGVKKVFIATDDQSAVDECQKWSQFECVALEVNRKVYANAKNGRSNYFEQRVRKGKVRNKAQVAREFIADLDTLGDCDFFVGQFASSVSRIAYELMFARKGHHVPFVSLQWPWASPTGHIN